jgi:hypothetical protein
MSGTNGMTGVMYCSISLCIILRSRGACRIFAIIIIELISPEIVSRKPAPGTGRRCERNRGFAKFLMYLSYRKIQRVQA